MSESTNQQEYENGFGLTDEQIGRLLNRVKEVYAIAEKRFERKFDLPRVIFKPMGTVGGRASYVKNELWFSPVLYTENQEDYLVDTVVHEIAHLLAWRLFNGQLDGHHGWQWKATMWSLGRMPTRCHDYDTTNARMRNKVQKDFSGY